MASGMSNYLEELIAKHVMRNSAYTSPTTIYLQLHYGSPADSGSANQLTPGGGDTGSDRQAIVFDDPIVNNGLVKQNGALTFTAGSDWYADNSNSPVSGVSIWDASSAGNCLVWGDLAANVTIRNGDKIRFEDEAIQVTFD